MKKERKKEKKEKKYCLDMEGTPNRIIPAERKRSEDKCDGRKCGEERPLLIAPSIFRQRGEKIAQKVRMKT